MSNHNYTKYSNKNANVVEDEAFTAVDVAVEPAVAVVDPVPEIDLVNETVDTVAIPETVTGVVVDCAKLNVRVAPNAAADVICTINVNSEFEINVSESTEEWFKICTASGIEGYCMRKFVKASL